MKKILIIMICVLSCVAGFTQDDDYTRYLKYDGVYGTRQPRIWPTKVLRTPTDTVYGKIGLAILNSVLYFGDSTRWYAADAGSGLQAVITRDNSLTKIDTVLMKGRKLFFVGDDSYLPNLSATGSPDVFVGTIDTAGSTTEAGLGVKRIIRYPTHSSVSFRYGFTNKFTSEIADSATFNTQNGDGYMAAYNLLEVSQISGFTGKSILKHTVNQPNWGSGAQLGIVFIHGAGGSNRINVPGWLFGNSGYLLLTNNQDTISNWMGNLSGGGGSTGVILKSYDFFGIHSGGTNAKNPYGIYLTGRDSLKNYMDGSLQLNSNGSATSSTTYDERINSSAAFEVNSTTRGTLLTRMTSAQRTAITHVAGLIVFDTDSASYFQSNGSAWQNLYNTGGGGGSQTLQQVFDQESGIAVMTAAGSNVTDVNGGAYGILMGTAIGSSAGFYVDENNSRITINDGSGTVLFNVATNTGNTLMQNRNVMGIDFIGDSVVIRKQGAAITKKRIVFTQDSIMFRNMDIVTDSTLKPVVINPVNGEVKVLNSWAQTLLGGGSSTFVSLTDGPGAFTGQALKGIRVNAGETALEYVALSGAGTVTEVATGLGLSGGPINTTGTIIADTSYLVNKTTAQVISGAKNFTATPTFSTMTANRLLYAGTGGLLSNSANLTYDGTTFAADAAAIFNETGADVDFRIESDVLPNMFFVDASTSKIGIGINNPADYVDMQISTNADVIYNSTNTNAGGSATAGFRARNAANAAFDFKATGTGFTTAGGILQDAAIIISGANLANGISVISSSTTNGIRLYTGGSADANKRLEIDVNGNFIGLPVSYIMAVSDETTDLTTGTAKITFRIPHGMTVTEVRASVNTVSSSGTPTIDINESGTTILSTKITIDVSEESSETAAVAPVISDAVLADDAEITIDIDTAGTGAKGLKIIISGTRL